MKRLLDAGLIAGDREHLWLTPAGVAVRDAELAKNAARDMRSSFSGLLGLGGSSLHARLREIGAPIGVDLVEWLTNAEARAVVLAKKDAASDIDDREGWPGAYERGNLSPEEYGGEGGAEVQRATYELNERLAQITGEDDTIGDPHGSYGPAREIDALLENTYYQALVSELIRLRPDMREAGDDGEG